MAKSPTSAGNRIREVRKAKGLTMEELGERAGLHFTTIAKLERSMRGLSSEKLSLLAAALEVDASELVNEMPEAIPVRMVPVIGKIAAGGWQEAILDPIGYMPAPVPGRNTFALEPQGTSMDLIVRPGAQIIVDPDQLDLVDTRLYAVMNTEGETTFKRYRSDPPRLEPVSSDPAHQPIPVGREPFTVIGRVVWQGSSL